MRNDEMADALSDISGLAVDASNSIVALMRAAIEGRLEQAGQEAVLATNDLNTLVKYIEFLLRLRVA